MTFYIDYLNASNNFRQTRVEFETFEEAREWGKENLENFDWDMIRSNF